MAYEESLRTISLNADASLASKTGSPNVVALTVTNKELTSNVATITVGAAHGFSVGQQVVVAGVDATFNGIQVITAVGSATAFSYAKTASNVSSTAATGTVTGTAPSIKGFQYRFVKVTGARTAGLATSSDNGGLIIGVLQNKPQVTGAAATIAIGGVTLVEAGASISAGNAIKADSLGRGAVATVGTDVVVGFALAAATVGQLVPVLLQV